MLDPINILKVVGIMAALIAFRMVVQILLRKSGAGFGWLKDVLPFILPPLLTGGPMFLAFPVFFLAVKSESIPSFVAIMSLAGGLGLMFGLMAIVSMLMKQQRRIQELEGLLPVQENEGR
ncbi:MAG: hypothetical protein HOM68_29625 [Gemmatimonadetes bacterium]|jgi:hypothetical protein|nr:hypothetical protein [Gemmatimonadota bacterium]MBT4612470.1 hypothetical protein [Gemmatimonadota bacterium]MBT5060742.1 hypothetical protein [Gemmatimonadota bacterium]MBT5145349.1 hypothetical protein [Gemmatimonadota bacterium]MBT5591537.1 hypothetical protein [Gemmatimonadota bacterium]